MVRAALFVGLAFAAIMASRRSHAAYQPGLPRYPVSTDPAQAMQESVYFPDAAPVYYPDSNLYGPPAPEYFPDSNLYDHPPAPEQPEQPDSDNFDLLGFFDWGGAMDAPSLQPVSFERRDMDPTANLQAFLKMIRVVESRDNYRALVGGGEFSDFSQHPARLGWQGWKGSRAAGAYQIQPGTMNEAVKQAAAKGVIIPDFSPASQDLLAVEILQFPWRQGAYRDVIHGRVTPAMQKLSLEWEAFQKMLAGNYPISVAQARDIYANAGGGFGETVA